MKTTVEQMALIFFEELERDHWGDIDPYWFLMASESPATKDYDDYDSVIGLQSVLAKVLKRVAEIEEQR